MRILVGAIERRLDGSKLAPRPSNLNGKVVAFLDGWGDRQRDGTVSLYPLMRVIKEQLAATYGLTDTFERRKPNVSERSPRELIEEIAMKADVVVNGECA